MRRVFGYVLIGLGVLLLVLAPLLRFYVAPKLAVAPLRCTGTTLCDNGVSLSPSAGTAETLFDPTTLTARSQVPLEAQRRVQPDAEVSTPDQTMYNTSQIVNDQKGTQVDGTTARYAFNGHTSQMLDCCHSNVNGVPIEDFSGVMPLKFPFGVEQKDYLYYDDTINQATTAKFVGTDTVEGLTVDKFVQVIAPTKVGTLEVPGALVGVPRKAAYVADRYYSNTRTMWVEPTTGVIVNGTEDQLQTLRGPDGTDQLTLIKATLVFTPENVSGSVSQAEDGKSQLDLIQKTLPLAALVLGLVALVGGVLLVRRRDGGSPDAGAPTQPATAGAPTPA